MSPIHATEFDAILCKLLDHTMAELLKYWLFDPIALLFLASLATLAITLIVASRKGAGIALWQWGMSLCWVVLFMICAAPSAVNPILTTLEDRYPDADSCQIGSHLIVLGGGVDSRVQSASEFERMSLATLARASTTARILEQEPSIRALVAGGAVRSVSEADVIAEYLVALGVDNDRIIREPLSKSTRENALEARKLLAQETIEGPVMLVTSAMHMPRALASFRQVFIDDDVSFCPVSVDRQAFRVMPRKAWLPQTSALLKFDKWLHEIAAISAYKLKGWM